MRIILLATDEAPLLAPLTDTIPGPLVPIVNRPMVSIALEMLARAGYKHALVSLYNRSGSIASFLNSGRRWGMMVDYLTQREALGNAGALRWAGHLLNETFLVLPADSVLDLDIEAALAFHRTHGGPATIIAGRRKPSVAAVPVAATAGRVTAIGAAADSGSRLFATGAYLFEASVLDAIPAKVGSDIASQLIPSLLGAEQQVCAFECEGYWNPMQSFDEYHEAQRVFLFNTYYQATPEELIQRSIPRLRYPSIDGRQIAPGVWVGLNDAIHPSVQVAAPVCIGDNCWIGRDAEIGPEVVIGANAVIDEEATVAQSTVFERTYVGRLLRLDHVIANTWTLIDTRTSESTTVVDSFLLSEIGAEAPAGVFRRVANLVGATLILLVTLIATLPLALCSLLATGRVFDRERRIGSQPPTLRQRQATGPYGFDQMRFATERLNGQPTRYGRWLLNSGLAYLPALLNVIQAECELVGVKPLRTEEAAQIQESWQQKHFDRPAGLTGAWYVQGISPHMLDDVLVADAYYVSTRTWHSDILLLWQTLTTWLWHKVGARHRSGKRLFASDIG